jgi:hypothetical protein
VTEFWNPQAAKPLVVGGFYPLVFVVEQGRHSPSSFVGDPCDG